MMLEPWYHLKITNLETFSAFSSMLKGWFENEASNYSEFVEALLDGKLKEMNAYMNDVALTTFSSFDAVSYTHLVVVLAGLHLLYAHRPYF